MKFEENEVRELLAPILPLSAETKHKMKIAFDRENCLDNDDVRDFRDEVMDLQFGCDFISASFPNPFGSLKMVTNKNGVKEKKESESELALTIEYSDLINAQFEVGSMIKTLTVLMNKYSIVTKTINVSYVISKGKEVGNKDDFSDIDDGTVKELA